MIDYSNIDNFYWHVNFPNGLRISICFFAKSMQANPNVSEQDVAKFFINQIKKTTDQINLANPGSVQFVNPFGLPGEQVPVQSGGGNGGSNIPGQIIDGVFQILKPQQPGQQSGGTGTGTGTGTQPTIAGFKLSTIIILAVFAKILKIW